LAVQQRASLIIVIALFLLSGAFLLFPAAAPAPSTESLGPSATLAPKKAIAPIVLANSVSGGQVTASPKGAAPTAGKAPDPTLSLQLQTSSGSLLFKGPKAGAAMKTLPSTLALASSDPTVQKTGIRGRTVDSDGRPVVRARVTLFDAKTFPGGAFEGLGEMVDLSIGKPSGAGGLAAVMSDEKGWFQVTGLNPSKRLRVVIEPSSGELTKRKMLPALRRGELLALGEFKLLRGVTIRGVVLDGSGAPVPGAMVNAHKKGGPMLILPNDLRVPGTSEGEAAVEEEHEDGGKKSAKRAVMVISNGSDGQVFMSTGGGWKHSDAQGRFSIEDLPPGDYELFVKKQGLQDGSLKDIHLKEGGERRDLIIRLRAGVDVELTIKDQEGHPIVGAEVYKFGGMQMFGGSRKAPLGRSDNNGLILLKGVTGGEDSYRVEAKGFARSEVKLSPGAGTERLRKEVVMAPGAELSGRLVLPDGAIPQHAVVYLRRTASERGKEEQLASPPTPTKSDGRFRLPALKFGRYVLMVQAPGRRTLTRDIELKKGQDELALGDLVLADLPKLVVTVLDQEDKPVEGAVVTSSAAGSGGEMNLAISLEFGGSKGTDAEGKQTLKDVQPGRINLKASVPERAPGFLDDFQFKAEAQETAVTLRLAEGGKISGRVLLPAGASLAPKSRILLFRAGHSWAVGRAPVNAEGGFLIDLVAPGRYQLQAVSGQSFARPDPKGRWFDLRSGDALSQDAPMQAKQEPEAEGKDEPTKK